MKRKFNMDDSNKKCIIIADSDSVDLSDNDSDDGGIEFLVWKRLWKLIIEDNSDDEDRRSIINYRSNGFGKKKIKQKSRNIYRTSGIRVAILDQLDRNKRELGFSYIIQYLTICFGIILPRIGT